MMSLGCWVFVYAIDLQMRSDVSKSYLVHHRSHGAPSHFKDKASQGGPKEQTDYVQHVKVPITW
jgi:hypothetical protein